MALASPTCPKVCCLFLLPEAFINLLLGAYLVSDKKEAAGADGLRLFDISHTDRSGCRKRRTRSPAASSRWRLIGRGLMSRPKLAHAGRAFVGDCAAILVEKIFEVIGEIRKNGVTVLLVERRRGGARHSGPGRRHPDGQGRAGGQRAEGAGFRAYPGVPALQIEPHYICCNTGN